jgi:hypothetical protein
MAIIDSNTVQRAAISIYRKSWALSSRIMATRAARLERDDF